MDSTRFRRRQIQTRPTDTGSLEGFVAGTAPAQRAVPWRPAPPAANELRPQPPVHPVTPAIVPQQRVAERLPRPVAAPTPSVIPAAQPARRLPPLDMGLPGAEVSAARGPLVVRRSPWIAARRWAFRGLAFATIAVLLLGGFLFSQGIFKLHKVFKGGTASAAALQANVDPNLLKGEGDGRINVLLLGRGGGTHEAPDLTDTLMLASIDPTNHTASLLSIPRDLWVDIPNNGAMKLNAAWETGKYKYLHKISEDNSNTQAVQAGFDLIDQTVENVIGVPIHYNVLIDFQAFKQAVDTVGGVTVNVPTDLIDPTMAWENNRNPVLAKAGTQTFDGTHALIYVRSRETTSDFARTERQRTVLLALKQKAETLGTLSNPMKISGLMSAFGNNVQTDLSLGDASRLYGILKAVSNDSVKSIGFADQGVGLVTTGNMNGQSVVEPKAGLFNYSAIQSFVRAQLKDPYIVKEHAKIMVLNGTTQPGLAGSQSDALKSYGYNVTTAANAPTSGYSQTVLVDLSHGTDKYTRHYLEQRYNVAATTRLPDQQIQPNGADFVIIVGSDETALN